jgi:hypothetical protein
MKGKSNGMINTLVAVAVLAALGFGGYMYETRDKVPDESLLVGVPVTGKKTIDGDLLTALTQLKRLTIDTSIFKNKVWLTLYDFGQTLAPQKYGRINPFAPFDGAASASAGPTTGAAAVGAATAAPASTPAAAPAPASMPAAR